MPYYAVKKGRSPGVYKTWTECNENIKDYDKAVFKKFDTEEEAIIFIKGTDKKSFVPKTNPICNPNLNSSSNPVCNNDIEKLKLIKPMIPIKIDMDIDNEDIKSKITIKTDNLMTENNHIINKQFDFESGINIYVNGIYIGPNGTMDGIGSIFIYFGPDDPRNELRKLTQEKYPNLSLEYVLFKSVLVSLNKVISDIVEQKTIIIHTNSLECIKNITNDPIYYKGTNSLELVQKCYHIVNNYPNIKFFYNKGNYISDWIHDQNILLVKKENMLNLKEVYSKIVFLFGKYKNYTFGKVFNIYPDYFDWCLTNCKVQINEIRLFLESKND